MKVYTDPPTKKYNNPGGDWNRGQGDKPMNTIQNTQMIFISLHKIRVSLYPQGVFGRNFPTPKKTTSKQGGWNLVHGPVGVAEWLQDLN